MIEKRLQYLLLLVAVIIIGALLILISNYALIQNSFGQPTTKVVYYNFSDNLPESFATNAIVLTLDGNIYSSGQLPYVFVLAEGSEHAYSFSKNVTNRHGNVTYVFDHVASNGCGISKINGTFGAARNCDVSVYYTSYNRT